MEKSLGRFLKADEFVHHIDGDPTNNDIKNLVLVNKWQHRFAHNTLESCVPALIKMGVLRFDKPSLTYKVIKK